ncbi:MAG: LPS export ABC transporter permease LptF [Pseudomonadota bacterium]
MIIVRYINRQLLQNTIAITLILLVVVVMGRLLRYLTQASQGELQTEALLLLLSYRLPGFLQLILPLALLLSILLVYGRMYAESEMPVLIGTGFSPKRLLGVTMVTTTLMAILAAFLSLFLTPRGLVNTEALLDVQKNLNEFDLMVPGVFQTLGTGERTTYAESVTGDVLHNVFMHETETNRVIFAATATPVENSDGERFIQFQQGSFTTGDNSDFALTSFDEFGVILPPRDLSFAPGLEEESMTIKQLLEQGQPTHIAELQWRFSLVILLPVLALFAVPLSKVSPREGRFARMVPALLLYLTYFGLLVVSRDMVARGILPTAIGLWWVHLLFIVLGWLLFSGRIPTLPAFFKRGARG